MWVYQLLTCLVCVQNGRDRWGILSLCIVLPLLVGNMNSRYISFGLLLLEYRIVYPLSHLSTFDRLKSSFPELLEHFKWPLRIALRIVDVLNAVKSATCLIERKGSEYLPSSFFSILSSCSLIGLRFFITPPLIDLLRYSVMKLVN